MRTTSGLIASLSAEMLIPAAPACCTSLQMSSNDCPSGRRLIWRSKQIKCGLPDEFLRKLNTRSCSPIERKLGGVPARRGRSFASGGPSSKRLPPKPPAGGPGGGRPPPRPGAGPPRLPPPLFPAGSISPSVSVDTSCSRPGGLTAGGGGDGRAAASSLPLRPPP